MGKHSKQINVYMLLAAMLGLGLSRDSAGKYMSRGKGIRDNLGGGGGAKYNLGLWIYISPLMQRIPYISTCGNLITNLNTGTPSQMQVTHTVTKIMYSLLIFKSQILVNDLIV